MGKTKSKYITKKDVEEYQMLQPIMYSLYNEIKELRFKLISAIAC